MVRIFIASLLFVPDDPFQIFSQFAEVFEFFNPSEEDAVLALL